MKSTLNKADQTLVEWVAVRNGSNMSAADITRFAIANPTWPDPLLFRRQAERAQESANPSPDQVIAAFNGTKPYSDAGALLLARAHMAKGQRSEAARIIRGLWHDNRLSGAEERTILGEFGALLTADDHRKRLRWALLESHLSEAMQVARKLAGQQAEIVPLTATRGFPYIASRAEAQISGANVLEMIAEHHTSVDAVIVAAFGDPGLVAARELFDLPVVGMAEAAVMTAAMLGERFSVVTFSPHMARWYTDCVRQTGLEPRFTGVRCPDTAPASVDNVAADLRDDLIGLVREATAADGADVVILGGAPLAGLAQSISAEAPGILIDPVAAATAQAMTLVRLAPCYARRVGRPAPKPSSGLAPALSAVNAGGEN